LKNEYDFDYPRIFQRLAGWLSKPVDFAGLRALLEGCLFSSCLSLAYFSYQYQISIHE